jgi:benzoyl-CoA reductase/2-hydroxyglutaryl-CoA dehydratase subunit BcrC/BadD/HgdB
MIGRRLQYELAGRIVGPALMTIENMKAARKWARRSRRTPFGPPLGSTRKLKDLMSVYYFQGRWADGAVPVAWVTSGFPVEVLRAHGFYCVYPENHGALCSARHVAQEYAEVAEASGYSRDLCSYARVDIGSVLSDESPVGRIPRPDVVAACSNICQTVIYWFRAVADHFGVPFVLIDTPFVYGEITDHELDFVVEQLAELREAAESVSGRRIEDEQLDRVVDLAHEGSLLWGDCLDLGRKRPAPWTAFDHFVHMAPIVALRGTEACNAYYRELRDELRHRVDRGIGGIADERHRLLWDNIAIWYKLRELSGFFAEHGFSFVCATYSKAWSESWREFDPARRRESTARLLSNILLNRDLGYRLKLMSSLIRDFEVDGVVLHSDRSCKPYSVGQYDVKDALAREHGVKVAVLEADHADPRSYSAEQAETRLQAFMESFS